VAVVAEVAVVAMTAALVALTVAPVALTVAQVALTVAQVALTVAQVALTVAPVALTVASVVPVAVLLFSPAAAVSLMLEAEEAAANPESSRLPAAEPWVPGWWNSAAAARAFCFRRKFDPVHPGAG
jgi:hypothetical protein